MDVYNQTLRGTIKTRVEMEKAVRWFEQYRAYWAKHEVLCVICKKPVEREWVDRQIRIKSLKFFGMSTSDFDAGKRGEYGEDWIGYLLACQTSNPTFTARFDVYRYLGSMERPICDSKRCRRLDKKWEVVTVHECVDLKCPVCGAWWRRLPWDQHAAWCSRDCKRKFFRKAVRSSFTFEVDNGR